MKIFLLVLAWIPVALIRRLIYPLVLIGLMLSAMPDSLVGFLIGLPVIEKANNFLMWLIASSVPLAVGACLVNLRWLVKDIEIMKSDQTKHSFLVGSVINYLEVDDFDWDEGMKEVEKNGLSWKLIKKQFINGIVGQFIGGEEGRRHMQRSDPFNTKFKRNGEMISFKQDLSDELKNQHQQ